MRLIRNLPSLFALIMVFSLSANSYASTYKQKGTVSNVDIENSTFTVVNAKTGESKIFNYVKNVKVVVDGKAYYDLKRIKTGQSVTLKFRQSTDDLAAADNVGEESNSTPSKAMELEGTIVAIDKVTRSGTLKQVRTNNLVKFRYADNLKNEKLPKKGDKMIFTYYLESLTLTSPS